MDSLWGEGGRSGIPKADLAAFSFVSLCFELLFFRMGLTMTFFGRKGRWVGGIADYGLLLSLSALKRWNCRLTQQWWFFSLCLRLH